MVRPRFFISDVLQADLSKDRLVRAGAVSKAEARDGEAVFTAPLIRQAHDPHGEDFDRLADGAEEGVVFVRVALYGDRVVRVMVSREDKPFPDESPMLEWHDTMRKTPCRLNQDNGARRVVAADTDRVEIGSEPYCAPVIVPDGKTRVPFQGDAHFFPPLSLWDALPLLMLTREDGRNTVGFALKIEPNEHFCGTGERFDRMDLFGRRIDLVNEDAHGASRHAAYKNVPFLMSSRPYGVFVHSSAKMRLDIGAHSTNSLQWLVEDDALDVFFIGGGSFDAILKNYRCITGFPSMPPTWSFGVWMGRWTYTSAEQVRSIADRLRSEQYPTDVLHVDTGWFEKDWKCDWEFSKERFPDTARFLKELGKDGFRMSLWQWPYVQRDVAPSTIAREKGYVAKREGDDSEPDFYGDTIDFTNPEAVAWYKGLLKNVLETGVAAIKADFGEVADESAAYHAMDAAHYRNMFSLLYQRAVWEATREAKDYGLIWARAGWAGSQRYPVHWAGDNFSTYDSLAGTIRGGLHFGLSGFAFWSHDVGGFLSLDGEGRTPPSDDFYLRSIQFGTFTSHMRFHGCSPREPWEYPSVADLARQWLRFRYALIPYIIAESEKCCASGLSMLRPLVAEWTDDENAWGVCDQYLFGDAFLVCPTVRASGVRDVYLPPDQWVDFWTGEIITGPAWLKDIESSLSRMPLYVRYGATIEFAEPVQCTDQLDKARRFNITFDENYPGFDQTELGRLLSI